MTDRTSPKYGDIKTAKSKMVWSLGPGVTNDTFVLKVSEGVPAIAQAAILHYKYEKYFTECRFQLEATLDIDGELGWDVICPWVVCKGVKESYSNSISMIPAMDFPARCFRFRCSKIIHENIESITVSLKGISGEHLDPKKQIEEQARDRIAKFGLPSRPPSLPESLPADHGGQLSLSPESWALTLKQYIGLMSHIRTTDTFCKLTEERDCGSAVNLYKLNDFFVKPWTANTRASIAVLFNPQGLSARLMVSHAWAEASDELEDAFQEFFRRRSLPDSLPLWLCLLANYQPRQAFYIQDTGPTIGEQLELDPFGKVIRSEGLRPENGGYGMIAVHTTTANLYSRLWCPYEMNAAVDNTLDVTMAPSRLYEATLRTSYEYYMGLADGNEQLAFDIWTAMHVKTAAAFCNSEIDRRRIVADIEQSGGFARLDQIINLLRRKMIRNLLGSSRQKGSGDSGQQQTMSEARSESLAHSAGGEVREASTVITITGPAAQEVVGMMQEMRTQRQQDPSQACVLS